MNNTQVDDAHDIDLVIPMYILIKYRDGDYDNDYGSIKIVLENTSNATS